LKKEKTHKRGIKGKRFKAGLDVGYAEKSAFTNIMTDLTIHAVAVPPSNHSPLLAFHGDPANAWASIEI